MAYTCQLLRLFCFADMVRTMLTLTSVTPEEMPPLDNLFQTAFWGLFKNTCGQTPLFFSAFFTDSESGFSAIFPLTVFIRTSSSGATYGYAPKAPFVSVPVELRGLLLEQLSSSLKEKLPDNCVMMRYDLCWHSQYSYGEKQNTSSLQLRMNWGTELHNLYKSPVDYLCPDTVIINTALTPEQILNTMRGTTRNCIRRAYKSGIDYIITRGEKLSEWHKLYKSTAERKCFYYEPEEYFERLFEQIHIQGNAVHEPPPGIPMHAPPPLPELYIITAEKGGIMLSGIVLAVCGKTAYYMYAGSSLAQRELMPNYGLQWEAIRFARSRGCTQYDLMGIPSDDTPEQSMAGLYIFKTGFGGQRVHFAGTWDFPYNQNEYEKIRNAEQMYHLL